MTEQTFLPGSGGAGGGADPDRTVHGASPRAAHPGPAGLGSRRADLLVLRFTVFGSPAPQGSKHSRPIYRGKGAAREFTGKVATVESSNERVKTWREAVKSAALDAMAGQPLRLDGYLRVSMLFTLKGPPGSRPKWVPAWMPWSRDTRRRPASVPDLSKLARSTEDALTDAGAWVDDARVVEYGRLAKFYPGDPDPDALGSPGALITIWQIWSPPC